MREASQQDLEACERGDVRLEQGPGGWALQGGEAGRAFLVQEPAQPADAAALAGSADQTAALAVGGSLRSGVTSVLCLFGEKFSVIQIVALYT